MFEFAKKFFKGKPTVVVAPVEPVVEAVAEPVVEPVKEVESEVQLHSVTIEEQKKPARKPRKPKKSS